MTFITMETENDILAPVIIFINYESITDINMELVMMLEVNVRELFRVHYRVWVTFVSVFSLSVQLVFPTNVMTLYTNIHHDVHKCLRVLNFQKGCHRHGI